MKKLFIWSVLRKRDVKGKLMTSPELGFPWPRKLSSPEFNLILADKSLIGRQSQHAKWYPGGCIQLRKGEKMYKILRGFTFLVFIVLRAFILGLHKSSNRPFQNYFFSFNVFLWVELRKKKLLSTWSWS